MERGTFVDEARIHVAAGDGGNGSMSFLREPYKPKGRPDGGNGGDGGSVILEADTNTSTLLEISRNPHLRSTHAKNGSGNTKHGAAAPDRVAQVPVGTIVLDEEGNVLADLVAHGERFVAAQGGRGGRGNAALATARRRAPGFAERGEQGEERWLRLELKVLADVGLVGFPNAGKSSLISRLSAARPKIAAYPFTTLTPNLGVSETADARYVIADVPGLIEGASEGRGLGLAFLRHLDRCRVLCFVVDVSAPEDPGEAVQTLRAELRAHDPSFDDRPSVLAANKIDVSRDALARAEDVARAAGFTFVPVSASAGDGIEDLSRALADAVALVRAREAEPMSHRLIRLRPEEVVARIEREGDAWRVHSARAERLLRRFDINNREALAFVQDQLLRMGVEDALATAGARAGDEVRIDDLAFEFEPEHAESEGV